MARRWAWLAILLLAGCAEVAKPPEPVPAPKQEPAGEAPVANSEPKFKNSTLKYLANRNLKPQPTRPLNVKSSCSRTDAIGTKTKLDLLIKESQIQTFRAEITMKGHGMCRFNLEDFDQVEKMPQPLLRRKKDESCRVRVWEQGPRITIAFNSCPKACEGDAFNYLWPILVEAKSGRCF